MFENTFAYTANGTQYVGLHLSSAGQTPKVLVVLLPDWRGQSALARDHSRCLVELGYDVVIADLYGDGFSPTDANQVGPMVKRLLENRQEGVKALHGCVEGFRAMHSFTGPVFCLGYSAGGMVAVDYGRSGATVAGIVVCSGLLKTAGQGMQAKISAPVLFLQGTQDEVSPLEVVSAVIKEMDEVKNDFRFELFGQTHHAFDNPDVGTDPTARLVYSPSSAKRARSAILEFISSAI